MLRQDPLQAFIDGTPLAGEKTLDGTQDEQLAFDGQRRVRCARPEVNGPGSGECLCPQGLAHFTVLFLG